MMPHPRLPFAFLAVVAGIGFVARGGAQCSTVLSQAQGLSGIDGSVRAATMWDPDGAGPASPLLVLGGSFRVAGTLLANGIVAYDLATRTWSRLGSDTVLINALAVLPNGDLVAGGGLPAGYVARWTGSTWAPLGVGVDAAVLSLTVRPNGDLIAGGYFSHSGTEVVSGIARWDGSSWLPMGTGMNQAVQAVTALPNGDVVAGGWFTYVDGQVIERIARWNGSTWSALGTGVGGEVHALATMANGDLIAAGEFTGAGGLTVNNIARWDGAQWSALGTGITGGSGTRVRTLLRLSNGDLVAGGYFFTAGGVSAFNIARWDGTAWSTLGNGLSTTATWLPLETWTVAELPGAGVVVGGDFRSPPRNVARWDGAQWSSLGAGMDALVYASARLPNGDLVIGGSFQQVAGVAANHIARWDGAAWHALGAGTDGIVVDLAVTADGDLIAVGGFGHAGAVAADRIARWDGATWSAFGPFNATTYGVWAVAATPGGDVYVAGWFMASGSTTFDNLARWNGASWTLTGNPLIGSARVTELTVLSGGDLVAVGDFTSIGGVAANRIARWDGVAWHPFGSGLDQTAYEVLAAPNGDVYAMGTFDFAGGIASRGIARWDGAQWHGMAGGLGAGYPSSCSAAVALPNGDLIVGGAFAAAGGVPAQNLARWNGTAWSTIGNTDGPVFALAWRDDGTVLVGGDFLVVNGAASAFVAGLATSCPAAANSLGGGCASSGGPNLLAATALPWLGGTFRAEATGVPAASVVFAVTGFLPASVPLATIVPQGVVGCDLLTTVDFDQMLFPLGGVATVAIEVPNTMALVGLAARHQMIPCEFGAGNNLVAVTSTNVLALTIGAF